MKESEEIYVKILCRYYSDALEEITVETMWATVVDQEKGWYKIDNIPFYGPAIASDDIVYAEFDDDEQMLTYKKTVSHSGNSIVQVILMNDSNPINEIRKVFELMGCPSERINDKYFSLEIPKSVDYLPIKLKLQKLEDSGDIGYAEPILSSQHTH